MVKKKHFIFFLFNFFVILLLSCKEGGVKNTETIIAEVDTKNKPNYFKSNKTKYLIAYSIAAGGIGLDELDINYSEKKVYVVEELLTTNKLDNLKLKLKEQKAQFEKEEDYHYIINLLSEQKDTLINEELLLTFFKKQQLPTLIPIEKVSSLKNDNNLIYQVSYPYITKSKETTFVVINCLVGGQLIEWMFVYKLNKENRWDLRVAFGLGDYNFAVELSKTPFTDN